MNDLQTERNIKIQFVASLMEYFKIEEDLNLRAHIADLTDNVKRTQYREFFRRLSAGNMPFKNPYEKISIVAKSLDTTPVIEDESAKKLYNLMYDLRKNIIFDKNSKGSAEERFKAVYISKIKNKNTGELLLNSDDIDVIRNLGKQWIFENVAGDKSYFLNVVNAEYERVRLHVKPQLSKPKEA